MIIEENRGLQDTEFGNFPVIFPVHGNLLLTRVR
jgi:hypothetical protein